MKGWNNTRLKNLLNEPLLYGLNVSSEYEDRDMPRYIRITDFDDFNNLNEQTFKSLPEEIAQSAQLKDGDLLFARSGASVGKTFLYRPLPNGACYAGYLIRARFDRQRVMPEYVSYYTKSQGYENWKNATYIQATIQNISAERYYQLPISIPPLEEQGRIVTYLNDKTGKIDARISLLTKKRDAYQRLKKALISRVVTKGLNPNAKFKPSGVDWIGEIPEGWKVKRIKEIGFIASGTTPKSSNDLYYENGVHPWLNTGCVQDCIINEPAKYITDLALKDCNGLSYYPKDTILIAMYGGGTIGNVGLMNISATINQACCAIVLDKHRAISKYLFYCMLYNKNKLISNGFGGTQINLSQSQIANYLIVIPPLSEQQSIATYLDEKCSEIDANIANLEKQIEKYKELKRALISEVVTGKRRV